MPMVYYNILTVDDSTTDNDETFAPFIHTNNDGVRFLDFTKIVPIPDDIRAYLKDSDAYKRGQHDPEWRSCFEARRAELGRKYDLGEYPGLWLLDNWGCSGPSESRLYPFGLYFATLDSPPITTVWQFAEQLGRPLLLAWSQCCVDMSHGFYRVDRKGEIVDSDSFDSEATLPEWLGELWAKKYDYDSASSAESQNRPLRWGLLD